MKKVFAVAVLSSSLVACVDRGLSDQRIEERDEPLLSVTEPQRGSVITGFSSVVVKGTASDPGSGLASVTINGIPVEVEDDGSFELQVPAPVGINLLHTEAIDRDGNVALDTRSVLTGQFVPQQTPVQDAFAARINDATLGAIGLIGAEKVEQTDLGAAIQPFNPIMKKGITCLNVSVFLNQIEKSDVELVLDPVDGGLSFSLAMDDLFVDMDAEFKAVCIGGSSGLYLSASRFQLDGTMALGIGADGRLDAAVIDAVGTFDDFNLDVGFIPGSVVEMIVSDIDVRIANAIATQLETKVPALIEEYFGDFGIERSITLLGNELDMGMKPSAIDFDTSGGTIVLDGRLSIKGDDGGAGYLTTPAALPNFPQLEAPGEGFKLAMSDDIMNAALNAFWAAGVMEKSIDVGAGSDVGLGALVDRVDIYMPLPPVVQMDPASGAALQAVVGDLLLDVVRLDANGADEVVARIAVSAEIALNAEVTPSNAIRLRTSAPVAYVDVVQEGVTGPNPLNDSDVESLAAFVSAQLTTMIGSIVGEIPIPGFQSAAITNLSLQAAPAGGYVVLGGNVEAL